MTSFTSRLIVASTVLAASMGSTASEESLNAVISNHWDWVLEQYPEYRREFGDMSGTQEWTDLSLDAMARRNQDQANFIEELAQIDEDSLSPESRLNRRMLMTSLEEDQESYANGLHLIALNMRSGPQHLYTTVERLPMRTEQDYIDWLVRLEKLPTQLDQYLLLLDAGLDQQRVQAQIIIQRIPNQLDILITENPEDSPFYEVFETLPSELSDEQTAAIQSRARDIIGNQVTPAYKRFKAFVEEQYLPASRAEPGIGSLPGGKQIYEMLARHFTTTDLTPQEIHDIGLAEVSRIRGEMEDVIDVPTR